MKQGVRHTYLTPLFISSNGKDLQSVTMNQMNFSDSVIAAFAGMTWLSFCFGMTDY